MEKNIPARQTANWGENRNIISLFKKLSWMLPPFFIHETN